jgi:hypothetical protein
MVDGWRKGSSHSQRYRNRRKGVMVQKKRPGHPCGRSRHQVRSSHHMLSNPVSSALDINISFTRRGRATPHLPPGDRMLTAFATLFMALF